MTVAKSQPILAFRLEVGTLEAWVRVAEDLHAIDADRNPRRLAASVYRVSQQLVLAAEWIPSLFGTPDPLENLPKLAAYWRAIQTDPLAARLIAETRDAIAERKAAAIAASKRPSVDSGP